MSDPDKSFFSGLHGAVTGMAAFVTSIVAVVGLALNQGWIGGGHSRSGGSGGTNPPGTTATVPSDTTTSGSTTPGGSGPSDPIPHFTVDPTTYKFVTLGPTDFPVTVKNIGLVPMTILAPFISGADKGRFAVTDLGCTGTLNPGRSCQIKVTFNPTGGTFTAALVIDVVGAPQSVEVTLNATIL